MYFTRPGRRPHRPDARPRRRRRGPCPAGRAARSRGADVPLATSRRRPFRSGSRCTGRADEYRPATILRVDVRDGSQRAPVDLRPDPERFPPPRGVGQGSVAALDGAHLYLAVPPMLYDYEVDALDRSPRRVLDDLVRPPVFFPGGRMYAVRRSADGAVGAGLIDLNAQPLKSIALPRPALDVGEDRGKDGAFVLYVPSPTPTRVIVRVADGALVTMPPACNALLAATGPGAAVQCRWGPGQRPLLAWFAFPSSAVGAQTRG